MKRIHWAALAACTVLLAACGGGGTTEDGRATALSASSSRGEGPALGTSV